MSVEYIPHDPATNANPFPVFRQLREDDPVHWNRHLKSWVLTRYDHVKQAAYDDLMSADRLGPYFESLSEERRNRFQEVVDQLTLWMLFRDPPDHTRLRQLVAKVFTPRALEALRPQVESLVKDYLDQGGEAGRMDLIKDLAYPLPVTVIMVMLGAPAVDLHLLKVWSDDMALFIGNSRATPDKYGRAQEGAVQMGAYFRDIIAARRRKPEDDMISALVAARDEQDALTEDEIVATCTLLLFAGHETTTNLIGNGMYHLMTNPDQWRRLCADPSLIQTAVEECLRYDSPANAVARAVARDHELEGRELKKGDRVFAMLNAANRDPREFKDPESFDIARKPNRHLAFGTGIHFCLGAALARLEGQIALRELSQRFPETELITTEPEWMDSLVLRGVGSLELSLKAKAYA